MSYKKTEWVDRVTPVNAENMNHIEDGIYENSDLISLLSEEIDTLNSENDINKDNIETLNTKVSTIETNIESLNTNVQNNTSQIETLNSKVATNENDIGNLKTNVQNNTSQITTLKSKVSTNETNIKNNTDLTSLLSEEIDTLNSENDINKDNIENLENNKQDVLISGRNIKTINGNSLLGEGNLTIQSGGGGTQLYNHRLVGTHSVEGDFILNIVNNSDKPYTIKNKISVSNIISIHLTLSPTNPFSITMSVILLSTHDDYLHQIIYFDERGVAVFRGVNDIISFTDYVIRIS